MRAEFEASKPLNPVLPATGSFANEQTTYNAQVPPEGPKVFSVLADFSLNSAYDLNLTLTQASGQQRSVAGVFIDNSTNAEQVNVLVSVTNQLIKCPAHCQGYFTVFCPKNATITMTDPSGSSSAKVGFWWTNFPVANQVWPNFHDLT